MRNRFIYLISIYFAFVIILMLQKPIFMLANLPENCSMASAFPVMWHGLKLDFSVAGYYIAIPVILTLISIFIPKMPVRGILSVWYIIVAAVTSIAFVADSSLYEFWHFKLDASVLFYLQSPVAAAASTPLWYIILKIVEILIYATLLAWILIIVTPKHFEPVRHKVISFTCTILLIGIDFIAIRGGVGRSTANVGKVYFSNEEFLNHSSVNPVFSFLYSLGKTEDFGKQFRYTDDENCEKRFSELYPQTSDSTDVILSNKRPNILLIILEGVGAQFISALDGEEDITPNINSIIDSAGIVFTHCYGNSFRTDRGLVSILSGHLSYPTTSIMKMPAKSKSLPGIASTLSNEGYNTEFIYGGDINFTNMQSYLRGSGFENLISDADFSASERNSNAWGVADHIMFDYLYNNIKDKKETPWFVTMLTLSSHEPFEVPYDKFPDNPMANAVAYTDHWLGDFINDIRIDKSLWDNTLIAITSDHGVYYRPNEPRSHPKYFRIPFIITGGALASKQQRIDYTVAQSDIASTLLSILDIEHSNFPYSRNVLSSEYRNGSHHAYYSYINGFGIVTDSCEVVTDNESGKIIYNTATSPDETTRHNTDGKITLQYLYSDLARK